jgi:uncharacterized membrane protein
MDGDIMANPARAPSDIIMPTETDGELPVVRTISPSDLVGALRDGFDDFAAMPTHVVFLCVIYPVLGILLARVAFGYNVIPLLYPLAAGFTIVGPIAAIGLYELSRRRELGLDTSWRHAFDVIHSPSLVAIAELGLILLVIFGVWIASAQAIYQTYFGYSEPGNWYEFLANVFSTGQGIGLILIGNAVGLVFAILTLVISAVSFPLLLDRNVGMVAAVLTSAQVVLKNPITMALWGLIVAVSLAIGFALFLLPLIVVIPILGHATWHLYRRAVEPDTHARPVYQPKPKGVHYGADFPASLFVGYRRKDDSGQ